MATITVSGTPGVEANSELVLVTTRNEVAAFSGVTGRVATLQGSFQTSTNETVGFARGTTAAYAYSPILDRWVKAPAVTISSVHLIRNGAVLVHPGGYWGFASRTGTWTAQPSLTLQNFTTKTRYALFAGIEGNCVHLFDSRYGRWASVCTQGTPTVSLFRVTAVVHDGFNAYGFGLFNSVWDWTPLKGWPVVNARASSSIGIIQTATDLHTYTAHGSFSMVSRFPEFSRYVARGGILRYLQTGPQGAAVTAFFGFRPARVPLPPLGTVFVDPASLF